MKKEKIEKVPKVVADKKTKAVSPKEVNPGTTLGATGSQGNIGTKGIRGNIGAIGAVGLAMPGELTGFPPRYELTSAQYLEEQILKYIPKGLPIPEYSTLAELWQKVNAGVKNRVSVPIALSILDETGQYKEYRKEDKDFFNKGIELIHDKSRLNGLLYVKFTDEQSLELIAEINALGGKKA